jgi:hypothetical protein
MGYNEIDRLRKLFIRDTEGLLNQTHRLILFTITSFDNPDDPRGCFVAHEDLLALTNLKTRAWQENIHHLTDGKGKWEQNKRVPCSHKDCAGKETHLGIVKRTGRAYKNNAQGYKADLDRYDSILSMRYGAPLDIVTNEESVRLETVEHAPNNTIGRATVHPYKQDKQDKQLQESSYVNSLNDFLKSKLETSKLFRVDPVIAQMLADIEAKGFTYKAVETALEAVGEPSINNPKGYAKAKLQTLLEGVPDWNMSDNRPPHCGECDPETRKVPYRYEVASNPPGATSDQCPKCNPYALQRKSA